MSRASSILDKISLIKAENNQKKEYFKVGYSNFFKQADEAVRILNELKNNNKNLKSA